MEIKEGMYVRTNEGYIAKVIKIEKDIGYKNMEYLTLDINLPTDFRYQIYKEDIIKASYDIIDLIEEGDYVNGHKVYEIIDFEKRIGIELKNMIYYHIEAEDIKSIVTQEQFKNMEYEVQND